MTERAAVHSYFSKFVNKIRYSKFWVNFVRYFSVGLSLLVLAFVAQSVDLQTVTHRDPALAAANFDSETFSLDNGFVSDTVSSDVSLGGNGFFSAGDTGQGFNDQNSAQPGSGSAPADAGGAAYGLFAAGKAEADLTNADIRVNLSSSDGFTWREEIYNYSGAFAGGNIGVHFVAYHCKNRVDAPVGNLDGGSCDGSSIDFNKLLDDRPNDSIHVPAPNSPPTVNSFSLRESANCGRIQVDYALPGGGASKVIGGRVFNFGTSCDQPAAPAVPAGGPAPAVPPAGGPAPGSAAAPNSCPNGAPLMPQHLRVRGQVGNDPFPASQTEFVLEWDRVDGANYFVRFDDPRTPTSPDIMPNNDPNATIAETEFKVTGINDSGVTYNWWVHSTNECGTSDAAHATLIKAAPTVPAPPPPACPAVAVPANVAFAPGAQNKNNNITWTQVSGVTYVVTILQNSAVIHTSGNITERGWYTLPDTILVAGQTYTARVTADNECNQPQKTEINFSLPNAPPAVCPVAPTPPVITSPAVGKVFDAGTTSVTVTWNPVVGADGYRVVVNGQSQDIPATQTQFIVDNVVNGTTYNLIISTLKNGCDPAPTNWGFSVAPTRSVIAPACVSLTASTNSTTMGQPVTFTAQVQGNNNLGTITLRFNNKVDNLNSEGWTDITTLTSGVPYTYTTPISTKIGKHWFDILVRDKSNNPVAWWETGEVCRTSVDLAPSSNLVTITKDNNGTPTVPLGQQATFNITVTNISGRDLSNVQVIDDLPAAFTYASGTTQGNTYQDPAQSISPIVGTRLTWSNISMATGATWSIRFKANTNQVGGPFINYAQAIVDNQTIPQAQAQVTVTGVGTKQCSILTNPSPATGVAPLRVSFSGSFTDGTSVSRYEWDQNDDGSIESRDSNPAGNFTVVGTSTIRLRIYDASGNTATCTVPVTVTGGNAALTMQKFVVYNGTDYETVGQTVHTYKPDETVNYALDITNSSGAAVSAVQIVDTLPTIFTAITPITTQYTSSVQDNRITWTIPSIPANSAKIRLLYSAKVKPDIAAGTNSHINTAILNGTSAAGTALTPITDTATIYVSKDAVSGEASLTFTKTPTSQTIQVGQQPSFTLTVTNTTNRELQNIQVTDDLPAGFSYVANSTTTTCNGATNPTGSGQSISWTISTLGSNQSCTITFKANAPTPTAQQTYRNNAKATIGSQSWTSFGDVTINPAGAILAVNPVQPQVVQYPAQIMGVQALPKTGLPAIAWAAAAFIPVGIKLRKFSRSLMDDAINNPNFIWEDRQFKK